MESSDQNTNQAPWGVILLIIALVVIGVLAWQVLDKEQTPPVEKIESIAEIEPEPVEEIPQPEPEPELVEPEIIIPEPIAPEPVEEVPLPVLDESDVWVQENLSSLTWRKELLKLVINDDMIRRFVVFTDNFAQGGLAYEHSPFTAPVTTFSALEVPAEEEQEATLLWDDSSTRRFSLYVDLLRSVDSDTLVDWYLEAKPLIDQAYAELGYPDSNFTETLQSAITRVLDMEIPKEPIELVRPSVMYQYKKEELESLDDADKLLLRLGRENLLVIKSVLLEINEKLARESNGQ